MATPTIAPLTEEQKPKTATTPTVGALPMPTTTTTQAPTGAPQTPTVGPIPQLPVPQDTAMQPPDWNQWDYQVGGGAPTMVGQEYGDVWTPPNGIQIIPMGTTGGVQPGVAPGTLTTTAQPGQPSPWGGTTPVDVPAPQQTGYGNLSDFGPENNIVGQQISPTGYTPGADTTAARQQVSTALQNVQAPDRQALATESLRLLDEATADERSRGIQQTGQSAARLGRLGSGMVTTDLGNLEERLQRSRDQAMRGLAGDTAAAQMSDRLASLGATQGVYGQLEGADQGAWGTNQAARNELRGERQYQYGLDQNALDRRIQQEQLSQQMTNDELQRAMAYNSLLGGYGYEATSPIYQALSQQYGNQAAASGAGAGDLMNAWALWQGTRPQQQQQQAWPYLYQ